MKISVYGTGYVGLVTGVCFAEMGNHVICLDIDENKIHKLKDGISPIYEPGLDELLQENIKAKRVEFSTDLKLGIEKSDILFIAVGTPTDIDGSADLKYVLNVAKIIGENMNSSKLIVNKSTVPIGTATKVQNAISEELKKRNLNIKFEIISNPEFLKEGAAIADCMRPSRVVIGLSKDSNAKEVMSQLYAPFFPKDAQVIQFMDTESSEMTKYAANAMLATKISFMNELSRLCEKTGANIESVRLGIGSDPRIGNQFLYAGIGYGGSCFPKDVKALIKTSENFNTELPILNAVERVNATQRIHFFEKIKKFFSKNSNQSFLDGKKIAVWGLSFKPGTDDVREAPSLDLIKYVIDHGATVKAHDPIAIENFKKEFSGVNSSLIKNITFYEDQYEALEKCDALIIATEWKSFREPDYERVANLLNQKIIFDGRNIYSKSRMKELGFEYFSVGR